MVARNSELSNMSNAVQKDKDVNSEPDNVFESISNPQNIENAEDQIKSDIDVIKKL